MAANKKIPDRLQALGHQSRIENKMDRPRPTGENLLARQRSPNIEIPIVFFSILSACCLVEASVSAFQEVSSNVFNAGMGCIEIPSGHIDLFFSETAFWSKP
jgi:hypothetical protein